MNRKSELGQIGEDKACQYLVKQGFTIIERNYNRPYGEIDIIAKDPDKTLAFVEVKTMQDVTEKSLRPEDQLTRQKYENISKTALVYANNNPSLIKEKMGWRIDLVCIIFCDSNDFKIIHYKNIQK